MQEYEKFIKNFVPPNDLRKMLYEEEVTLGMLTQYFAQNKSNPLFNVFNLIKDLDPILPENGKKATFYLKSPIVGKKKTFDFVKKGEKWHIFDPYDP